MRLVVSCFGFGHEIVLLTCLCSLPRRSLVFCMKLGKNVIKGTFPFLISHLQSRTMMPRTCSTLKRPFSRAVILITMGRSTGRN